MSKRKGNKVINILDDGFVQLHDNWVTESDCVLKDYKLSYNVLEFKIKTEEIEIYPYSFRLLGLSGTRTEKYSCVKLDKPVKKGAVLYTVLTGYIF